MIRLLLAALTFQCPDGTPPPCRSAAAASTPARAAPIQPGSIAVFPFSNRSPDSSDAYLADALPEQIIGRLARVQDLKVKSATAVSAQWRRTPDPMAAARALRVEWFVSGSVRRVGRQIAVSAELVRAASGDGAWSAPFRRGDDDLAAIEEQVAESIAVGVIGRLAPAQRTELRRSASRNVEAYRLYLLGSSLIGRRTTADIQRAVQSLSEAVRLDPRFAAAWARLGYARTLQMQWGNEDGLETDSLQVLGRTAIERALRLDSNLAEAWQARASHGTVTQDPDLAATHAAVMRALALDSLNADSWHALAYLYSTNWLALPEPAERNARRALELNPDLRNTWRLMAEARFQQGRYDDALAFADSALSRGAWGYGYYLRSWIRWFRGDAAGAVADLDEAVRIGSLPGTITGDVQVRRLFYRVAAGDSAPARHVLEGLRATTAAGRPQYHDIAVASVMLGMRAEAIEAIERFRALPNPQEPQCGSGPCSAHLRTWRLLQNPAIRPLHDDPRIRRLLDETRPTVPWLDHERRGG